jgi:hypothetical protein
MTVTVSASSCSLICQQWTTTTTCKQPDDLLVEKPRLEAVGPNGVARSTLVSIDWAMGDSVGPAGPGAEAQAENPLARVLPERGGGDQVVNLAEEEEDREDRATAA